MGSRTSRAARSGAVCLRTAGGAGSLEGVLEHIPRQDRAFDADRILHDALQRHQVAELLLVRLDVAGHHASELTGETPGVLDGGAPDRLRHHRGAGLADRTARPLEGDLGYGAV